MSECQFQKKKKKKKKTGMNLKKCDEKNGVMIVFKVHLLNTVYQLNGSSDE